MNNIWAVIPAAGVGKRMQADRPKQYLDIGNKPVLQWTVERMISHPQVSGAVVAISNGDEYWQEINIASDKPVITVEGGAERCHSVMNGLRYLVENGLSDAWALVHDAARPCVRHNDVSHLIAKVIEKGDGGILGLPVSDTLKLCTDQTIEKTVSRDNLWRALTPQMFRAGELYNAIDAALEDNYLVTDDASAMEHVGRQPCVVEGNPDNIKITRPHDLIMATLFLQQQREET